MIVAESFGFNRKCLLIKLFGFTIFFLNVQKHRQVCRDYPDVKLIFAKNLRVNRMQAAAAIGRFGKTTEVPIDLGQTLEGERGSTIGVVESFSLLESLFPIALGFLQTLEILRFFRFCS